MSDKEFDVKIVTPDKIFFDSKGTMVEFNTTEGEIGVYPEHIPLTTIIAPGVLTIHTDKGLKTAALHSGFTEIRKDKVTFLAEIIEWAEDIDVERAEEAEKRARERLSGKQMSVDIKRAEFALKKAIVRRSAAENVK